MFGVDLIVGSTLEINSNFAFTLSGALVKVFNRKNLSFVIGCDTRFYSKTLAQSLADGLVRCGAKVFFVDVTTCGGLSFAIKCYKASAGIYVGAGDKTFLYNGFKIYNGNGFKISDEQMSAVRYSFLHDKFDFNSMAEIVRVDNFNLIYAKYLMSFVEKSQSFVLDVAHGSGNTVASILQNYLDFELVNSDSNGCDINFESGINSQKIVPQKWNIKIDGDGDKIKIYSPDGKLVDGDMLTAIFALYDNESLVTNLMTNNSLLQFLDKFDIKYELSGMGERRLVDTMLKKGYNLCGEKGGRVIFFDTKTSDAFITAIRFMNIVDDPLVQNIINLPLVPSIDIKLQLDYEKVNSDSFAALLDECEQNLCNNGKIIARINHLENYINIYIEADKPEMIVQTETKLKEFLCAYN